MDKKKIIIISSIAVAVIIAIVGAILLFSTVFSSDKDDKTPSSQTSATGGNITVTVESAEAQPGSVVKVPVKVSDNSGFMASLIEISYDGKVLEYMDYEKGDVITDYEFVNGDNKIQFLNAENENTTKNGTMFTLKFRVIGKSGDKSDIKISATDNGGFINFDEQDVKPTINNGTVTVK